MEEYHLSYVAVDCADPELLADFWSRLLRVPVRTRWRQYVVLEPTRPGAPGLGFQRVPEPRSGKNRLHVDLCVEDLGVATRRAVSLGASVVGEAVEDGVTARVLADPEGNVFCLVHGASLEP